MELQAVIGELYLLDGVVQASSSVPGLLFQPAPKKAARGRNKDTLFIHLSLTGRPADYAPLAQTLLDLIRQEYYQSTGSITAALRAAIMAANQSLLRVNMSKEKPARQGAVMCAVLRGQELFMVQAGEASGADDDPHQLGGERLMLLCRRDIAGAEVGDDPVVERREEIIRRADGSVGAHCQPGQ